MGVEHKSCLPQTIQAAFTYKWTTPKMCLSKKWCPESSSFVKKNQAAGSPWDLISINWQQAVKRWPIDVMVEGVVLVNAVIIDINDLSVAPLILSTIVKTESENSALWPKGWSLWMWYRRKMLNVEWAVATPIPASQSNPPLLGKAQVLKFACLGEKHDAINQYFRKILTLKNSEFIS